MIRVPASLRGALLVLAAVMTMGAAANDPAERLPDARQEARARALFQQVRCLVCQNESIDDSEADLAADLRRIVRAKIREGRTDAEIRAFLLARYGQFVLLRPRFTLDNLVLWSAPMLVVLAGGTVMFVRRRRTIETAPLTEEEQARLDALRDDTKVT